MLKYLLRPEFNYGMYLDHTFGLRLSLGRIAFWLK